MQWPLSGMSLPSSKSRKANIIGAGLGGLGGGSRVDDIQLCMLFM